jgi:hypothetical protein
MKTRKNNTMQKPENTQTIENQILTSEKGSEFFSIRCQNLLNDILNFTFDKSDNSDDEFKSMLFDICIWEGGFIGLTFKGIRLQEIQISGDNGLKIIQRQDFKNKWGQKSKLMNLLISNNL